MESDRLVQVLEYILSDVWHFLGALVLMAMVSMWHPIKTDVTIITGKNLKELEDNEE